MPVRHTRAALQDLVSIRAYIGMDNPAAANRIARADRCGMRSAQIFAGTRPPGLKPGKRELVAIWPYVIVYRIRSDMVEILKIRHGAQDRTWTLFASLLTAVTRLAMNGAARE